LAFQIQGIFCTEASNLGTLLKRITLLHAVHDCPCGGTAAIARHVSFAEITCQICCHSNNLQWSTEFVQQNWV